MTITFVLPGDNRSGGVRVTVVMANELLGLGHRVRLVYPRIAPMSRAGLKVLLGRLRHPKANRRNAGWVHEFRGEVQTFTDLNDLPFDDGEVVIAVGSLTIERVFNLRRNVIKVRYNHGLLLNMSEHEKRMWALPIPTITVSGTIIPDLEQLTGQPVRAVVPNGIDLQQYHSVPGVTRDGVGTIYGEHPAKAPADTLAVLGGLQQSLPGTPLYVFGTSARPEPLSGVTYERLPSVAGACTLYSRARIWFIASHTEGFSIPILEAMACGCAVVSTDTYGGRELIRDGENGLLVTRGDVDGMIAAIKRLMKDDSLRQRLAEEGLVTAGGFSWPKSAARMEQFLRDIARDPDHSGMSAS